MILGFSVIVIILAFQIPKTLGHNSGFVTLE
jgi:hypothetical protein